MRLLTSLALVMCAAVRAQAPAQMPATPPAINWVLPIFTDKEGYRSMTLRGSEVRPVGKQIAVSNLNITIFSEDAQAQVDSILLSPTAFFSPKEKRANGEGNVRFIRDDIEVTGTGWAYDHATKKISLQQNVRVTFSAQLKDILK
jgi:lipopolysaccharide export system protein LptC